LERTEFKRLSANGARARWPLFWTNILDRYFHAGVEALFLKGIFPKVHIAFSKTGFDMRDEYIKKILPDARRIETEFGIPAAIAITQSAHESNWGMSYLTQKYNNLFGVTASAAWQSQFPAEDRPNHIAVLPTYEYVHGNKVAQTRAFRAYTNWYESLHDWALLIVKRYPLALAAAKVNDAIQFFVEVQKGGYATDPKYSAKLINLFKELPDLGTK
jgi:flagellum-specific peptidoglycan hydrolase FlgJ